MSRADMSSGRTVTYYVDWNARELCLITPWCCAVVRDYSQSTVIQGDYSTSLWQTGVQGSTSSMAFTLACSEFLLSSHFLLLNDTPIYFRAITTSKFLLNELELLLSKCACLCPIPLDSSTDAEPQDLVTFQLQAVTASIKCCLCFQLAPRSLFTFSPRTVM